MILASASLGVAVRVPLAPFHAAAAARAPTPRAQILSDDDTESWDNYDDESYSERGMSIVSQSNLMGDMMVPDEVDALLSDWQEEQAILDDGESTLDQDEMMAQWRKMVERKERAQGATEEEDAARHLGHAAGAPDGVVGGGR